MASPYLDMCDFLISLIGESSKFLTGRPRGDPYSHWLRATYKKKLPNGSFFLHFPITYDIINKLELCQAPNPSAGRVICPKEEVIS